MAWLLVIYLLINEIDRMSKKIDIPDAIARAKFRFSHLVSIEFLRILAFSKELVSRLVLSSIRFKGMFPRKVAKKLQSNNLKRLLQISGIDIVGCN